MANSSILKGIAVVVGVGVLIKTAIVGFYITELPWIAVGWGVAFVCFKLSERMEESEAEDRNRRERGTSNGSDNW